MYELSFVMVVPVIVLLGLLVLYCWCDMVRRDATHYASKRVWAVMVLVLVPLGPVFYLLFEKVGLSQVPGRPPEEMTTHVGTNLPQRGH